MELEDSHVVYFKRLLDEYCRLAGQKVNLDKSEVFVSPNLKRELRSLLCEVLRVRVVDKPGIYLGVELDVTRCKLFRVGSCW